MRLCHTLVSFAAAAVLASSLPAAVLEFQGRVGTGEAPFNGTGLFHFALVEPSGAIVWSTGSPNSSASQPTRLPVMQGRFSVALGDTSLGHPPIDDARASTPGLRLRIWFNDQRSGWAALGQDLPLGSAPPAAAAPAAVPASPTAPLTAAQGDAILQELREIRALLARNQAAPAAPQQAKPAQPPAPQYVVVEPADSPALGSSDAPWVLMEFTEFQCPFCRRFSEQVMPELRAKLIDTGKVRFISRELPLKFHQFALPAAKVALYAHTQGKYWELRGPLFEKNGSFSEDVIVEVATKVGLEPAGVRAALTSDAIQKLVDVDTAAAAAAGITGTPSFVFGRMKEGKLHGLKIVGASTAQAFLSQLENEMAKTQRAAEGVK